MQSGTIAGHAPRLAGWLAQRAHRYGDRVVLQSAGDVESASSFSQLDRRSARLAAGFDQVGLRRGDAIAIWLPNRPTWMVVHFAAARLGLLTVPINTWCRESEVTHFLALGRCRAIVVDSAFRDIDFTAIVDAAVKEMTLSGECVLQWIVEVDGVETGSAKAGPIRRLSLRELETTGDVRERSEAENTRMIAYSTSGTTSVPKLAVHRESALLSHAEAVASRSGMTEADVVLGALPPCGAYGYTLLMAALTAGARALVIDEFDLDRVVEAIQAERVTILALTEPIMRKLLDHPRASREAFRSLRLVFSAGGTLQDVVQRAESEFGFRLTNVYGSSEILALAAFWDFERDVPGRSRAGGILTSAGMRVRAVDSSGAPVRAGEQGELQFSGPIVTQGYLENEPANRKAFTPDGWFRSGDLGSVVDENSGEFLYTARMNDALRIKGFLVSPGEIEAMLQSHPAVAAAQVVGIPDGLGEELAAAFVVPRDGALVEPEALRTYCRERMASYKTPTILQVVEAFPTTRSANGDKVMKNKLREMAIASRGA